jgi:bacteriorhodopsin
MTTTMKVFVSVLVACALIAVLGGGDRNWAYYAIGSLILAAFSAGAFAVVRRIGGDRRATP